MTEIFGVFSLIISILPDNVIYLQTYDYISFGSKNPKSKPSK